MAKYVGLDWAGKGWFGVVLEDDAKPETELFPTILSVWHKHRNAERIFIDIPIGLPEVERRKCDEEAAEELSPDRRSSVFWTPCRDAVYETTLERAKKVNEEEIGDKISNQTWAIMPRIREVDEFLMEVPEAREIVREVHPEVCFWVFNGKDTMEHPKSTQAGLDERTDLLGKEFGDWAVDIYEEARNQHICNPPAYARTVSKNAKDDILDAFAAALTAQASDGQLKRLPLKTDGDENPPTDAKGLPMEMVYCELDS